jgi:hypothetical protein
MIRFALLLLIFTAPLIKAAAPPGWNVQTLGSPSQLGSVTYTEATGQTAVSGPGHQLEGTTDNFQFIYQELSGDGEIVARVAGVTNPASYPRAGLMLRASLAPDSQHIEVFSSGSSGLSYRTRDTPGASTQGHSRRDGGTPVWMKLARLGPRVTCYTSVDGELWTELDATSSIGLPPTIYAGFSASSNIFNGGAVSTFDHLSVRQAGPVPAEATASLIGANTAGAVSAHNGGYVLSSTGGNLGGSTPGLLFYQVPFSGDGEIRARVTGLSSLETNSSVGLMVRGSLQPDAVYASVAVSATGLKRQHITEAGANAISAYAPGGPVVWLKLVRNGVLFTAFSSTDGTTWQALAKPFSIGVGIGSEALFGITLVGGGNGTAFAQASVDQVSWPQAAPPLPALDPVMAAGLTAWRKPDPNGIRCVDCHTPFGYDIAQFNFNRADVRLATTPHLPQADADAIFDMIEQLRVQYPPAGGLKDFRTFRPMQPGGGQIVGGENASANVRDAAFGFYLKDHFRIGQERIVTLAQAKVAAQELIDVDTQQVPVGIKFNLWSHSVLREGAETGGEIAEWLPAVGIQPKPEFAAPWFALQDAYLRDPSNANFWAIYHAANYWTRLDPHNFTPGSTHGNWEYVVKNQYLANSLFAHDELLKSRGLPSQLDAEDGVRPFPAQREIGSAELAPFWVVGDNARVVQGTGFNGMPRRNKESVHVDLSYNTNLGEVSGWQIGDLRLTWFWLGWMMDNSLRFSGEGSTVSGEYFIGSLWQGEVDNARTGDSDSTHGYRMHQVFFNAVQHLKLGFKPGAWRDNDGTQHFEASKGYYLGYDRWRTKGSGATTDIGLPGANALYKRLLSNHLRMAMLIHADEARKRGGVYFGENFTLYDLPLWRDALNWADPEWKQADEALLAELKASIFPPLTATETGDPDGDGQATIVEAALGTEPDAGNPPAAASQVERGADGQLKITFNRVREDFTYVVEAASDLDNWTVMATNPGTVGASVTVVDSDTSDPPSRFLRLRIIKARL